MAVFFKVGQSAPPTDVIFDIPMVERWKAVVSSFIQIYMIGFGKKKESKVLFM